MVSFRLTSQPRLRCWLASIKKRLIKNAPFGQDFDSVLKSFAKISVLISMIARLYKLGKSTLIGKYTALASLKQGVFKNQYFKETTGGLLGHLYGQNIWAGVRSPFRAHFGLRKSVCNLFEISVVTRKLRNHPASHSGHLALSGTSEIFQNYLVERNFLTRRMASDESLIGSTSNKDRPVLNLSAHRIFRELLTGELLTVVNAFIGRGHEVRIVGGAVRDILLSRHLPKDIDLATTATPDEMIAVFRESGIRYIETGLEHGTLTAHLNGHNFEITTLRIDTQHDGRRAVVEFTNDWRLDAERRDLTINAMSIDFDGNLYDYFGGVEDLKAKHVRFVGDPEKRIKEDYLRILRYFRFYGRISETSNDHVQLTLDVIAKCSSGLRNVAVERVWTELSRILIANFAPSLLKLMYELGVAENIGLPPRTQKHLDQFDYVWNHGHAHKLDPVTILMSLVDSIEEAEDLARSLRLSTAERNLGKFIVTHRNIHNKEDIRKPYKDILASCSNTKVILILHKHVNQLLLYQGMEDLADEIYNWQPPSFPVNGNDLKHVGIKPGPLLGRILHELKLIWLESYYSLGKDELLEKVDHLKETMH